MGAGAPRAGQAQFLTAAAMIGGEAWIGEAGFRASGHPAAGVYLGPVVSSLTDTRPGETLPLDAYLYQLIRVASQRVREAFGSPQESACIALVDVDRNSRDALLRAGRLAGVRTYLVSSCMAADRLRRASSPTEAAATLLIDWGADAMRFCVLDPKNGANAQDYEQPLVRQELGAAGLVDALAREICGAAGTTHTGRSDQVWRASQALRRMACLRPHELFGGGDGVRLLGEASDRLPVAGLRSLLKRMLRKRLQSSLTDIADWRSRCGVDSAPARAYLFGGLAEVGWLVALVREALAPVLGVVEVADEPALAVANGAAMLGIELEGVSPGREPGVLAEAVGLIRRRDGQDQFVEIFQAGARLPATWRRGLQAAGPGLTIEVQCHDASSGRRWQAGRLVLTEKDFEGVSQGVLSLTLEVDRDRWIGVAIERGCGEIVAEDWFPTDRNAVDEGAGQWTPREVMLGQASRHDPVQQGP
jgi:hypothetical protein